MFIYIYIYIGAIVTSTQIFDEAEEKEINIHCCVCEINIVYR